MMQRDFLEAAQHEDDTYFKFVDEGRVNVTVIAARSVPGIEVVLELDGAVNTASFAV